MALLLLAIILVTVVLSACAQFVLKLGVTNSVMQDALHNGIPDALVVAMTSPLIWFGMLMYVLAFVMWLWVLSKVELSVAYPFVGISFLITMAFGMFLLNEGVTPTRIAGTLLIIGGCILIGKSA